MRPDPDDFADLFPPDPPASGLTDDDLLTIWRSMHARGPFARGEAMLIMEREIARSHADALARFRELMALDYGPAAPAPDFGERRLGVRYGAPCAIVGPALPDPPTEDGDAAAIDSLAGAILRTHAEGAEAYFRALTATDEDADARTPDQILR